MRVSRAIGRPAAWAFAVRAGASLHCARPKGGDSGHVVGSRRPPRCRDYAL